MLEELGEKISNTVERNVCGVSPMQKEIIQYTVIQVFGEILKTVLLFAIVWPFGIAHLLAITIFSMAIYRIPSGGAHSKSHIACFVTSSTLFIGNVILSSIVKTPYMDIIYICILLFNIPIIYFLAPADTEMRPVVNKKQRKVLKIVSYVCMLGTILVGRFVIQDITIRNIFIFGTFIQSVTMLPPMYRLFKTKYGYRDGILVPQI